MSKYTKEQANDLENKLNKTWLGIDEVDDYGCILYQGWLSVEDMKLILKIIEEFDKENGVAT